MKIENRNPNDRDRKNEDMRDEQRKTQLRDEDGNRDLRNTEMRSGDQQSRMGSDGTNMDHRLNEGDANSTSMRSEGAENQLSQTRGSNSMESRDENSNTPYMGNESRGSQQGSSMNKSHETSFNSGTNAGMSSGNRTTGSTDSPRSTTTGNTGSMGSMRNESTGSAGDSHSSMRPENQPRNISNDGSTGRDRTTVAQSTGHEISSGHESKHSAHVGHTSGHEVRRGGNDRDTDRNSRDNAHSAKLYRLNELDDYKVADRDPDIRGWKVKSKDGTTIGKVDDLIVDTGIKKVRYLDLDLNKDFQVEDHDVHLLVPIGSARLHKDDDDVYIERIETVDAVKSYPTYRGNEINRDYEREVTSFYTGEAGTGRGTDPQSRAQGTDEPIVAYEEGYDGFYEKDCFDESKLYEYRSRS